MVVSDHSPCTPDLKKLDFGDFMQAWGGISSLQFGNIAPFSTSEKQQKREKIRNDVSNLIVV